jgi:glycosyltransferase involved in cell wall biosynthesis
VVDEAWTEISAGRLPEFGRTGAEFLDACLPIVPYAAATAFLGREKQKLNRSSDGDRPRVALIADGISSTHGVSSTIQQLRARGVPGYEVEVIGTDPDVDRRLASVAEVDVPFYNGMKIGVPSISSITDAIAEGRYDMIHVCAPGPAGIAAWGIAKTLELPLLGSYHTELGAYAGMRSGQQMLEAMVGYALGQFYGACDVVLSPSAATDKRLGELGIASQKIGRWDRGVDLARFSPDKRDPELLDGEVKVLYAGRLTKEKGVDLLADAFLAARAKDPRLHLNLAGDGPERGALEQRLGDAATFLGWQRGEDLAKVYASADVFMFASRTDTFGQVIREAQASGLPVVAVAEGGPVSLIETGQTGLLSLPETTPLAAALMRVVNNPLLAERLQQGALRRVKDCTWEAAMRRLGDGYARALAPRPAAQRGVA